MTSVQKAKKMVYFFTILPFIIIGAIALLFYWGEITAPDHLVNLIKPGLPFQADVMCTDKYYLQKEGQGVSLAISSSPVDLEKLCDHSIIVTAKVKRFYDYPLCRQNNCSVNKTVVVDIDTIETE